MDHHTPVYPMPTEGELVAFPHGAAGHQGISSNAAGDLLIKPCIQAEIDFYQAAADHPAFQAHMPVYVGKLERGEEPIQEVLKNSASGSAIVAAGDTNKEDTGKAELAQDKNKSAIQPKVWKPSGGKKLNTGLAIVLENAAAAFKKPNVMDLKLGSRLWDDDAPEDKRKKLDQVAAETTSGSLGFRVAGAKLWLGSAAKDADIEVNTEIKDGYKTYDKNYGRSLDEASAHKAIARFISGTKAPSIVGGDKAWLSEEARILTSRLIRELQNIKFVLENEESRMYSASVLIVIEGDHAALLEGMKAEKKLQEEMAAREAAGLATDAKKEAENEDENEEDDSDEEETGPKVMEVRLIDFAHAHFTPGQGPDENALRGINSIIEILKDINN